MPRTAASRSRVLLILTFLCISMASPALAQTKPPQPTPTPIAGTPTVAAGTPVPDQQRRQLPSTAIQSVSGDAPTSGSATVPGQANIFAASNLDPSTAGGGLAPAEIPLPAGSGRALTFSDVAGTLSCCGGAVPNGPDGNATLGGTDIMAFNGVSGIQHTGRILFLVGVFLNRTSPAPLPGDLVFSVDGAAGTLSEHNPTFAPLLNQTFFIGDGLTDTESGSQQQFQAPEGATHLYLGFADGANFGGGAGGFVHVPPGEYQDNTGQITLSYTVSVSSAPTPTPAPSPTPPPEGPGKIPVVFIPGISGSYLNDQAIFNTELWPGAPHPIGQQGAPYRRLSLYPSDLGSIGIRPNIVAPDAIRKAFGVQDVYGSLVERLQQAGYPEYQIGTDLTRRTTEGCDLSQRPNQPLLFVFAYDWRQDNTTTAAALKDYIGCVRRFYPDAKVDIVAHSMGGLVARRYIVDNPADHNVDALITIATPWLGAPKALNVLETGDFLGLPLHQFLISTQQLKVIAGSFPGADQLLPSRAYYDLIDRNFPAPLVEDGWDWNADGNTTLTNYQYDEMIRVVDSRYTRDGIAPGSIGRVFHDNPARRQDIWSDGDLGVTYFHIYGIQPRNTTIVKVTAYARPICLVLNWCPYVNKYTFITPGQGDETVPVVSASRRGNGKDYAQHITVESVTTPDTHSQLPGNAQVQNLVLSYLASRLSPPSPAASLQRAALPQAGTPEEQLPPSEPAYYLTVLNASSLVVSDTLGHSTLPISGTISEMLAHKIPDVSLIKHGENAETVIMPITDSYTVTFDIGDLPMVIEIRVGTGISATRAIRYTDLVLPAHTQARLTFSPQGIDMLHYDRDRDGVFESTSAPNVDVSGTPADDQEPPRIQINQTPQGNTTLIEFQAQDTGSGVQTLRYSLDGAHFERYTTPLVIDPGQTPTVFAFADDRAGNRSSLFQAAVEVANTAPVVGMIVAPIDPVGVNTAITAGAPFTDANTTDTHTAVWDWGDGTTSTGIIAESNGTGSANGSHSYRAAGVYTIRVTVRDQRGAVGQAVFESIVVSDRSAGFVIGGGWITSPAGAYPKLPRLTGKASFGFIAGYRKGAAAPDGQLRFMFPKAQIQFHSTRYQRLVIAGTKAQFSGSGTINGKGNYSFILTVTDGDNPGRPKTDKFRIKIWDTATGAIIYDSQIGAADDAAPSTSLGGGNIVIHR